MYAIGIGYPLEIKEDNSRIEIGDNIQTISHSETAVWTNFNGLRMVNDMGEDKVIFENLLSIGALKIADSLAVLLEQIYENIPLRQGAGVIKEEDNLVCLGERECKLSEIEYMIWKVSDGIANVKDIFLFMQQELGVDQDTFMYSLSNLDEFDLLFLR